MPGVPDSRVLCFGKLSPAANTPAGQPRVEFDRTRFAPLSFFIGCPASIVGIERFFMYPSIQVGKYLVSPLIRRDQAGQYIASVSIRSGHASMTQDRLMRFTPLFESAQAAVDFAKAEAFSYIRTRAVGVTTPTGISNPSGSLFATN
ncbi:hypothetical protein [Castellaniella caeni]|uniref:hypothetical protein n=1 Tax=Castellaniella caeni TaxID=266123 RepID=UPI0027E41408|nr:hypothetical protein [Castellaniella caeni]